MKTNILDLFNVNDLKYRSSIPYNRMPIKIDDFKKYTHLILGHMTSSKHLKSIQEKGLLPQAMGAQPIKDNITSKSTYVYLGSHMQLYYLSRADKLRGQGIVIIVNVPKGSLEADENVFSPAQLKNIDVTSEKALFESLNFGQCKHYGQIEKDKFLGIYHKDGSPIWVNKEAV